MIHLQLRCRHESGLLYQPPLLHSCTYHYFSSSVNWLQQLRGGVGAFLLCAAVLAACGRGAVDETVAPVAPPVDTTKGTVQRCSVPRSRCGWG
jgi:hypothetical protein